MILKGIDISKWQGTIDFSKVAKDNQNKKFVIIKATQGITITDGKLNYNSTEANKYKLLVSYYHYANTSIDAKEQANYFLNAIKNLPKNSIPLVLDLEENQGNLDRQSMTNFVTDFINTIKANNKEVGIYSYASFLNSNLIQPHNFSNIPLFLSAYPTNNINPLPEKLNQPTLPKGWYNYYLWQYSNKGQVNGIEGNVDLDIIPNFVDKKKNILIIGGLIFVFLLVVFFIYKYKKR